MDDSVKQLLLILMTVIIISILSLKQSKKVMNIIKIYFGLNLFSNKNQDYFRSRFIFNFLKLMTYSMFYFWMFASIHLMLLAIGYNIQYFLFSSIVIVVVPIFFRFFLMIQMSFHKKR